MESRQSCATPHSRVPSVMIGQYTRKPDTHSNHDNGTHGFVVISIGVNTTAFGRKLTLFQRHPAFHLKSPAFFAYFEFDKKSTIYLFTLRKCVVYKPPRVYVTSTFVGNHGQDMH